MAVPLRALVLLLAVPFVILLIAALRKPLAALLKLLGRTGIGLGVLALLHTFGGALGITPGVNLWNALTIALLGLPGLGLLLMLNWLVR